MRSQLLDTLPVGTQMAESTFAEVKPERLSLSRPAAIGTVIVVSHGRCCGEQATVTGAAAHGFTAVAACGWTFSAGHAAYRVVRW